MKGIVRQSRGSGLSLQFVLILMGAAGVLLGGVGADASAIHRSHLKAADVKVSDEWTRYLQGGPTVWAEVQHPPVTPAVESAIWKDVRTDPRGTDPMIDFLLWKQSLDPTRFAHYHPKLAPALHKIAMARSSPTLTLQVMPPTTRSSSGSAPSSPTPSSPVTAEPQNLVPSPSPEPSTLLIAAGMAAWAIVKGRGRRRGE
jgi:hypothetical protein